MERILVHLQADLKGRRSEAKKKRRRPIKVDKKEYKRKVY
jgi:hypothetical protein